MSFPRRGRGFFMRIGYGINAMATNQLNYRLGLPKHCISIRLKNLVLHNIKRELLIRKSMNRFRILHNIQQSKEARYSSNYGR